ncbi:MAG: (2Fe-2S)-binding protein [Bdellovibrionaceae bacterium]|nr:(2Fe-2S)-binding protein [Pseudobdellovibrionaceae bacterium]MDW8189610.1 (2Fe-2S)-binding protein [Pseudobdellovibrionaceae bacterium]
MNKEKGGDNVTSSLSSQDLKWDSVGLELTDATIICHCRQVNWEKIKKFIKVGATDLPQLIQRSRAGTGCGSCREHLKKILSSI